MQIDQARVVYATPRAPRIGFLPIGGPVVVGGYRIETRYVPLPGNNNIIAEYGNCDAAGMPMALATALSTRQIAPGDLVLFLGLGAGISVGAALIRW